MKLTRLTWLTSAADELKVKPTCLTWLISGNSSDATKWPGIAVPAGLAQSPLKNGDFRVIKLTIQMKEPGLSFTRTPSQYKTSQLVRLECLTNQAENCFSSNFQEVRFVFDSLVLTTNANQLIYHFFCKGMDFWSLLRLRRELARHCSTVWIGSIPN